MGGSRTCTVALLQMPFAVTSSPSLGLGLLKSALVKRGFGCDVYYLNLEFSRVIGKAAYHKIASGYPQTVDQPGEWISRHS